MTHDLTARLLGVVEARVEKVAVTSLHENTFYATIGVCNAKPLRPLTLGDVMFLLKKIVAPFFFPMPLILGCLTVGLMLLWLSNRQKAGRMLVSLGTLVLFLFSLESIAHLIVATLEDRYPPVLLASSGGPEVRWIVVLDSGHVSDPR
jgi:Domain of unknown function (DUF151)